ncbi:MAG: hypothetical protein ABIK28_08040, partial [Planctomycetota bacterium]
LESIDSENWRRSEQREITGPGGNPFSVVHNDSDWIKQREKLAKALQDHPEAKEAVLKVLMDECTENEKS